MRRHVFLFALWNDGPAPAKKLAVIHVIWLETTWYNIVENTIVKQSLIIFYTNNKNVKNKKPFLILFVIINFVFYYFLLASLKCESSTFDVLVSLKVFFIERKFNCLLCALLLKCYVMVVHDS